MKVLYGLAFLALLSVPSSGDSIVYVRVHRPLIEEQLKLAPATPADRLRTLRALFQKGGCPQVVEQQVPEEEFPNLICVLPGQEDGTLLVSAAFDAQPDDPAGRWNSLTLLPLLVESISLVPHRFTVMLAAFTGHPHADRGAAWYLEHLTEEQRKSIQAAIDLDDLGRTPPVYALAQPDRALSAWLDVAAQSLQLPRSAQVEARLSATSRTNLPEVQDAAAWNSTQPFVKSQVPVVAWRSASPDVLPTLQKQSLIPPSVTGAALDLDTYENTYRLLCVYVLYLDRNLGRPLVEAGTYTAKIIDSEGIFIASPMDTSIQLDRFTTTGELNRFELVLQNKGQDGLAEAVSAAPDVGALRFGMQLGTGVKLVVLQHTKKSTPYILVVAPRIHTRGGTFRDYRFTVLRLELDGNGQGDGQFYSTAKLRFRNHELDIEDYGSKPELIRQVRLEPPAVTPSTPGATEVAANVAAAKSPAAYVVSTSQPTASAPAPQAGSEPAVSPTFHAQARLVQVDVSATDHQGKPVTGLSASDFTVLEDGKPQPIRVFESHSPASKPAVAAQPAPVVSLPPHTYTNRIVTPTDDALGILLLDLLNTPVTDQAYARKQTIAFLKTLPSGKRIAMFVLSGHLMLVQEFTQDSTTLVAAAEKILNDPSLLLTTEAQRQQFQGATDAVGRVASPAVSATGASPGSLSDAQANSDLDFGSAQARQRSNSMMEADRMSQRVQFTLDALSALSRSVAGYPGRKNLVWLSGGFPIRLKPGGVNFYRLNSVNPANTTGLISTPDFEPQVRATAIALAAARVAVYPMDIRGVLNAGVDISVGAAESATFTGSDNPEAYSQNLNVQSEARFQDRSAIKEVAEQTGGEVLVGNDVKGAIARGLADGSTYYTLAYSPARDDSDPAFRRIEVKTNRGGIRLSYRPGYYPNSPQPAPKVHPLVVALQPGMPPATVIPLTVQVVPPTGLQQKTQISYSIDISSLDLAEMPDHGRRAALDCLAVAFKKDGIPAAQASNTMQATLTAAQYQDALRNGLQVRQEINLPPGQYQIRVGVMDRASQKMGTLEAPVAIEAISAAK
jgi:VWFA-related protein